MSMSILKVVRLNFHVALQIYSVRLTVSLITQPWKKNLIESRKRKISMSPAIMYFYICRIKLQSSEMIMIKKRSNSGHMKNRQQFTYM